MTDIKRILAVILCMHSFLNVQGQDPLSKGYFRSPLDIDLILSGNFAEIRSDHFHSGIDLKTQGVTGQKVIASADGYISRIRIESGGYGKTLYLAHPNGKTTVYAHLDRFRNDINNYVRDNQYSRNSHAVNIYPQRDEWIVKKGDVVAYSGNSGNSAGPHLHFEIRDSGNQKPENVLMYGFNIRDTIAPKFLSLWVYPFIQNGRINIPAGTTGGIELNRINGRYVLRQQEPLVLNGLSGFGIEAYDCLNAANNKCGLFSIEMLLDDKRQFFMRMDEFSFNESRYVNSFIDFSEKKANKRNIQKLFLDPNNRLSMYKEVNGQGLVYISDTDTHRIRIVIKDAYLNTSEMAFSVIDSGKKPIPPVKMNHPFRYDQDNLFDSGDVSIRIPAYSLYNDIDFSYLRETDNGHFLSDLHHIHDPGVPVHTYFQIAIRPAYINDTLKDKTVILSMNQDGEVTSEGGNWKEGHVQAQVNHFGIFAVSLDTLPPSITPLNINGSMDMTGQSSLRFNVVDDLSGIRSYDGYIDNEWVLFEFDAKNNLVFYSFDKERILEKTIHDLELYIVDNKDNISYFYTEFYW